MYTPPVHSESVPGGVPPDGGTLPTLAKKGPAHDFNNLLQIVQGNTDLAREEALSDEVREMLDEVSAAATLAAELMERIVWSDTWLSLEFSTVHLNQVLEANYHELAHRLGDEICLVVTPASTQYWIDGSAWQLRFALLNLCDLAREAMPGGGTFALSLKIEKAPHGKAASDAPGAPMQNVAMVAKLSPHSISTANPLGTFDEPRQTRRLAICRAVGAYHAGRLSGPSVLNSGSALGFTFELPQLMAPRSADED